VAKRGYLLHGQSNQRKMKEKGPWSEVDQGP
jgi:hypothetical protein